MRKLYRLAVFLKWWTLANALAYGQLAAATTYDNAINYLIPDGVIRGYYWRSFRNGYTSIDRIGWTFEFNESELDTDAWMGHGYIDKRPGRPSIWDDEDKFPRVI